MKRLWIGVIGCLCGGMVQAQFWDDFSSADRSHRAWWGDWDRFAVTSSGWLQSQVSDAAESVLWHTSEAGIDAVWESRVRIKGTCSAYNMVRFYVAMAVDSLQADGYFVQVGGANKNIVLYEQSDGKMTKRIESENRKQILSTASSIVDIRLERGEDGVFRLWSWVDGVDSMYVEEGSWFAGMVASRVSAVWVRNSKQRGYDYYLDDIVVEGDRQWQPVEEKKPEVVDMHQAFVLETESFSPNGDGWQDEVCIRYELPSDEYEVELDVYTAAGQKVAIVREDAPVSATGSICWNGRVSSGQVADIGVYVIQVSCRGDDGRTGRKRFVVALLR